MKRRGFLGFLGGAAVAGPAAAKSIVTEALPVTNGGNLLGALTAHSYGSYGSPISATQSGGLFSNIDRAMKLKRLLSGEEEDEPDTHEVHQVKRVMVEHGINVLRSVSSSQKVRIMHREAMRIERERMRAYWMRELLGLEKPGA